MKAENFIGNFIELLPLTEKHREPLRLISQDETIWQYMPASGMGDGFERWFDTALKKQALGEQFPFVVLRKQDNQLVGTTRLYNHFPEHLRMTVGYTWYVQSARGTVVNPESKYLLLQYIFEILRYNRVEIVVDARNQQSRAAVKKLGAIEEGTLRKHSILENGYVRDTVIFSIIQSDWPMVRRHLRSRLACYGS